MKIRIKNRWNGSVLFEGEFSNMKIAVEAAISAGANLRSANLRSADLRSAYLRYADLSSANLSSANLRSANLSYANLRSANLSSANLSSAYLRYADLRSANLRYANLRSAYLSSADLRSADLRSADLRSADLSSANLRSAYLSSPTMILMANWGKLSAKLTLWLMRYDASCHPDPKLFDRWANADGSCPYSDVKVSRSAYFEESKKIWREHGMGRHPKIYTMMAAVLDEKCPGWRK